MSTLTATPTRPTSPFATGLFFWFIALTLVVPAAPFNKVLFVIVCLWLLRDMLFAPPGSVPLMPAPLIVLGIFAYGFALSLVNEVNRPLSIQFFVAAFLPFLVHFVRRHAIDMDRLAERGAAALLAATVVYWGVTFLPDLPLAGPLRDMFEAYSLGSASEREFLEDPTISLHLGTVPFLFVAFCLCTIRLTQRVRARDLLWFVAITAGVVFSASRGLIAICLLYGAFAVLRRLPVAARILGVAIAGLAIAAAVELLRAQSVVLNADEISNATKIGHIRSYFDDLTPLSALFGRGLASYYFSSGSGAMTAHTEITPIDMARYFGVVLAILLYAALAMPIGRLARFRGENFRWVVSFALYLLLSTTNPVMFSSYGMLVVLWYWCKVLPPPARSAVTSPSAAGAATP
jgi:hypothetical protein